jgi:hypothetical protein
MDVGIAAGKDLALCIVRFKLDQERARRWVERVGAPDKLGRESPPGISGKRRSTATPGLMRGA